ncbi:ABC transporter substrate-binding protein [Hydrogenophaga sp. 2FB]|uniref:ABC transporter substrate-binding protein n=1 Tax=Hydrogenophaga sp. 2FB TaxID=2502187 RepID=UPI0010F9E277|nr:ABC transporter substrate-binding protein [Hydrogenophaga sp. 2FB]
MKKAVFLFKTLCLLGLGGSALAQGAPESIDYLLPVPATSMAMAPWMLAQHKGYFAQENIKVNFVAARGGVDVAKQIGAGNALIGGAIGDTPIIVRANGVPVKAIALLGAGSLTLTAVRNDSGIQSFKQLKGKTITVMSYADTTYYSLLGSLAKADLNKNDVNIQASGPAGTWQLFAAGKAQAMAAGPDFLNYAIDAGALATILPPEEGFRSMAQAVIASDEAIKNKPELLTKLVRATLRAMGDIMNDPKDAARHYVAAVPMYKDKQASVERLFGLLAKYTYAGQSPLGRIDAKRFDEVQRLYVSEGIVPRALPLEDLFTNQFVDAAARKP